jgi:DNA-directed RNA polymerase specialized sigma24 family protein
MADLYQRDENDSVHSSKHRGGGCLKWDEEGRNNFMEQIYHQHYRALMQQALYYLCFQRQYYDIAHDAVMDTFEAAYLSLDTFIHHPNPVGWLRLVLRRKLSAKMKRVYAEDGVVFELDELRFSYSFAAESEDRMEQLIRDHDNKALVERLMKRLKDKERRLIQMFYFEEQKLNCMSQLKGSHSLSISYQRSPLAHLLQRSNQLKASGSVIFRLLSVCIPSKVV